MKDAATQPDPGQRSAFGREPTWREEVLRAMLTVASFITPPLSLLSIIMTRRPHSWTTIGVAVGLASLPAVLRFTPGLGLTTRAGASIGVLFGAGLYGLARIGFVPGIALLLAATSIFGIIYLGRGLGFLLVLLGAGAFLVAGRLVTSGALPLATGDLDPMQMHNWVRSALIFLLLAGLLTAAVDFVIRQVDAHYRSARQALAELGALHRRLESAKEEERRFLAHELHDELAQSLTALKLRLQTSAKLGRLGNSADAAASVAVVDDLIARVRQISLDLRPPLLDEAGLLPALRAYVDHQATASGVAITLEAPEEDERLPAELEIAGFRVIQEAVTNALHHAAPRHIAVRVIRRDGRLALSVSDDGSGFDPAAVLDRAAAEGHLGVLGMRERVVTSGGRFDLRSQLGAGTTVAVELPV